MEGESHAQKDTSFKIRIVCAIISGGCASAFSKDETSLGIWISVPRLLDGDVRGQHGREREEQHWLTYTSASV